MLVAMVSTVSATNLAAQCTALKTCNQGGLEGATCNITDGSCPPCITFDNNGCFEKNNGVCPFGDDCEKYFKEPGVVYASS